LKSAPFLLIEQLDVGRLEVSCAKGRIELPRPYVDLLYGDLLRNSYNRPALCEGHTLILLGCALHK
jgi:hypothetical protein